MPSDRSASPPAKVDIAAIFYRVRRHKGLTLREVEEATGIPNAHISQIETGRIDRPNIALVYELATFYGLDFGLLTETGYENTPKTRDKLAATPSQPVSGGVVAAAKDGFDTSSIVKRGTSVESKHFIAWSVGSRERRRYEIRSKRTNCVVAEHGIFRDRGESLVKALAALDAEVTAALASSPNPETAGESVVLDVAVTHEPEFDLIEGDGFRAQAQIPALRTISAATLTIQSTQGEADHA